MEKYNGLNESKHINDVEKQNIQILRAFGILLVCLHHAMVNLPSSQVLDIFIAIVARIDVVVFFAISGYLFQKNINKYLRDRKGFIRNKIKQLVLPYLFWTLILYVGVKFANYIQACAPLFLKLGFEPKTWGGVFFSTITYEGYYVQHLWFLYVLFILFMLSLCMGNRANPIYLCVIGLIGYGIAKDFFTLPYIVEKILKHFPDFCIGRWAYCSEKQKKINKQLKGSDMRLILFAFCVTVFRGNFIPLPGFPLKSMYCRFELAVNSWAAVLILLYFSRMLLGKKRFIFNMIGDYSYEIYLMHTPYIVPICVIVLDRVGSPALISILIAVLMGVTIPCVVAKIIMKNTRIVKTVMFGK